MNGRRGLADFAASAASGSMTAKLKSSSSASRAGLESQLERMAAPLMGQAAERSKAVLPPVGARRERCVT